MSAALAPATPGEVRTDRAELLRALATLCEPANAEQSAIGEVIGLDGRPEPGDYTEVFLFAAYPYASVYLGSEGMLGGEARDRVAGFWRAIGMAPPADPDHLATILGLYAALVDAEEAGRASGDVNRALKVERARSVLLWEHLLSWLPPYLAKVEQLAPPFYASWARVLGAAMSEEGLETGLPEVLPLHLREAPELPDPDATAAEWIAALLAPVRSGVLTTRWDLRRAAADLLLGARVGERSFMLRALFEQDAPGMCSWLADEAALAASRHRDRIGNVGRIAEFWRDRAEACEATLRGVAFAKHERVV